MAAARGPVVIVGAGVVGASTAYHLAKEHGVRCVVIEAHEPAGAASGKAGGFLAKGWTAGSHKDVLVQSSFASYASLAAELGCDVQFRALDTRSVCADTRGAAAGVRSARATRTAVPWLDGRQFGGEEMGSAAAGTSAQVHPGLLTLALLRRAGETAGTVVVRGSVTGFVTEGDCGADDGAGPASVDGSGGTSGSDSGSGCAAAAEEAVRSGGVPGRRVCGVRVTGTLQRATLSDAAFRLDGGALGAAEAWAAAGAEPRGAVPASTPSPRAVTVATSGVVLCAGPWTDAVVGALCGAGARSGVYGAKAHSAVLLPPPGPARSALVGRPCALFLDYVDDGATMALSPEVYPRPDGTVYVCGHATDDALPPAAGTVRPRPEAARRLATAAGSVASALASAELLALQACFLPLSEDDEPSLGAVPGVENAWMGAGHGCWGILMAPATGRWLAAAAAGLDADAAVLDRAKLDPRRFLGAGAGAATGKRGASAPKEGGGAHSGAVPAR